METVHLSKRATRRKAEGENIEAARLKEVPQS